MAALAISENGQGEAEKGTSGVFVILALVMLLGAGIGAGFGFFLLAPRQAAEAPPAAKAAPVADAQRSRFPVDSIEVSLAPIIATVGQNSSDRVRLECSIVVAKEVAMPATLKTELADDIIAFLRGISIADISGAHGYQNLREDLDEVARIRGGGAVLGLLISGFVVE